MSQRSDPSLPRDAERPGLGPTFGAMLQEFNVAARLLNLDPGIWRILTHPKRQICVSFRLIRSRPKLAKARSISRFGAWPHHSPRR